MTPAGFPHSDISGSKSARDSPELFAACHVLHRLLAPRHPPRALCSLTPQPLTKRSGTGGSGIGIILTTRRNRRSKDFSFADDHIIQLVRCDPLEADPREPKLSPAVRWSVPSREATDQGNDG